MLTPPQKRELERKLKDDGRFSHRQAMTAISHLCRSLTTWELAGELPRLSRPGLVQRLLGTDRIQG
jgi:hypothetical protein